MLARTRRQREIYDYITSFMERHGYEPSYQQIARHFRIRSKSAIAKHVAALETQGLLTRRASNGKFNLKIQPAADFSDSICCVPLMEKLTDEFESEQLFVPRFLLGETPADKIFAFRVPSESMIEEHICPGDIALFERRACARDGECVVALIENRHPTLERFYNLGDEIELRPANPRLNPLRLPLEFIAIRGVFRGLLRSLVS